MHNAAVFVLSSGWEGLPTVLIEALACGAPVVSTRCPSGPEEILENGTWGELAPVGDVEALARAIERTLDNPGPDRGERARAFTPHQSGLAYLRLLRGNERAVQGA
jgi:glycosyltransferase involved in cell wall biosynthesis